MKWIAELRRKEPRLARALLTRLAVLRNALRDPVPAVLALTTMPRIADKLQRVALVAPARIGDVDHLLDDILSNIAKDI